MIVIGSDHGGFHLKEEIKLFLEARGVPYKDVGCFSAESCDYPDVAKAGCDLILKGECSLGILLCGTGIGISIAANKIDGIRAACCSDYFSAKFCRAHNDANVLCMGGRVIGAGLACELVDVYLNTEFESGRHSTRIAKISALEQ